jgi:hypothetical protein
MNCPNCNKEIEKEWIYCFYCGKKLRHSNIDETYSRILDMYRYENIRRQSLDSKAATYIGLTSVMVTILLVLGNFLFNTFEYSDSNIFLFISYICVIIGFIFSSIFAFKAYHTGSIFTYNAIYTRLLSLLLRRLVGSDVYKLINPRDILQFIFDYPENAKKELIKNYLTVWNTNYNLNNLKSNRILICYTLSSLSLILIAITTIIGLIIKIKVI